MKDAVNNYLPYPFQEAEKENSLIYCREGFGWVRGITFIQARETLAEGLWGATSPPSPKSSPAAPAGCPTCVQLHPRATSAGIPPSPMVSKSS